MSRQGAAQHPGLHPAQVADLRLLPGLQEVEDAESGLPARELCVAQIGSVRDLYSINRIPRAAYQKQVNADRIWNYNPSFSAKNIRYKIYKFL